MVYDVTNFKNKFRNLNKDEDKIIIKLNDNELENLKSVFEDYELYNLLKIKLSRIYNRLKAKQIMFWEDMTSKNEIIETAINRGKSLDIAESNGDLHIIQKGDGSKGPYVFEFFSGDE